MKRDAGVSATSSPPLTNLAPSVRLSARRSGVASAGADASSAEATFRLHVSGASPCSTPWKGCSPASRFHSRPLNLLQPPQLGSLDHIFSNFIVVDFEIFCISGRGS